eukprot:CCRYP_005737-RI/>CCRYP_005737-RI protein AED:0.08 eAED:0.08 QI:355/0.88/0.9/1/0.66/0.5/10/517/1306
MGLFKLSKDSKSGIPSAIEFTSKDEFADSDTRMTGDDDEYDDMTGRGINSRGLAGSSGAAANNPFVDPLTTTFRPKPGMVGRGVNSRILNQQPMQQQQQQGGRVVNPFDSNEDQVRSKANTGSLNKNPFDSDEEEDDQQKSNSFNDSDKQNIDDVMMAYEEKMRGLDETKFMSFGESDEDEGSMLSGIEEENSYYKRRKGPGKAMSITSFFGRKGGGNKSGATANSSAAAGSSEQQNDYHRPAVDSEFGSQSEERNHFQDGDDGSYVSGEYDAEFDNAEATTNAARTLSPNAPIGVPNGKGSQLTHRQLEDELYLYKLETLNLTDACRELAEQLDEAERKLESVQAQATFRIHALEAELQDGHVGLKSLVKMTSTEMDGRLEALRALGKTASIQAEKIKERDLSLNLIDNKLRKTLRDIKRLRRENKLIKDEKMYLKQRLEELEEVRDSLEGSLEKLTAEANNTERELSRQDMEKMEAMKNKLNDTLEQVGYLKSQVEYKDKELEELRERCAQKEAEIEQVRDDLALKENDVVRVELQLERVRKDLFEAAAAAKTAEEARVEAQSKEAAVREELDEALGALDEVTTRVAMLESNEAELRKLLEEKSSSDEDKKTTEDRKTRLHELEEEVVLLKEEKDKALRAVDLARESYESVIAERQNEIETLNKDVEVHAEQMLLAQSMLDEKESLVVDLRAQLDDIKSEYNISRAQLEEDLATRTREVSNIKIELEERTNDVSRLEDLLSKVRSEISRQQSSVLADAPKTNDVGDKAVPLSAVPSSTANVAEMELRIERLERELGTSKRQIDAAKIELEEREKATERIRSDTEKLRLEKNARVEELENMIEEKNKSLSKLRRELDESKQSIEQMKNQLKDVQSELAEAIETANRAEDANQTATNAVEKSKAAEQAANHTCEKLKTQVELLQKEKDVAAAQLKAEMQDLRNEMVHYKEKVESEEEQKAQALQAIANKEYFEEDERSLASMNSSNRLGLFSRFTRSKTNALESDTSLDVEGHDKDKDARIEQLEKSITENVLIISNLKNELVAATLKFNKDEAQRRMLIQRLENENQAYSIKLEVLENEFNQLKKKRESSNFDSGIEKMKNKSFGQSFGQSFFTAASDASYDDSTSSMSGVSAISGASKLTPLERDNKKLRKQKILFENRISSLQTQLSEIQQIVPELMSKSKSQIAKLEATLQTQKEEAEEKEKILNEEISELKQQNEQLQAATRSRLQASDMERQDEIEQLKMRLEAREATIAKLESLVSSGKSQSQKNKGTKLLRKKRSKNNGVECENSVVSGVGSSLAESK